MRRNDKAYIGFSCDAEIKKKALALAKRSGHASLGSVCRVALQSYLSQKDNERGGGYHTIIQEEK